MTRPMELSSNLEDEIHKLNSEGHAFETGVVNIKSAQEAVRRAYEAGKEAGRAEALEEIERFAGKVFGLEVVVSEDPNDERFIAGFAKGKEFMREEIQRLLASIKGKQE